MALDMSSIDAFVQEAQALCPGFCIRYKDESRFMRCLGLLVSPFNAKFATEYATTIGSVVYLPTRAWAEKKPAETVRLLAHELVHAYDAAARPLWFPLSYLLPQVLSPVVGLGYLVALLATDSRWSHALLALALLLLAPWPAPGRAAAEVRGYTMSLAALYWSFGSFPPAARMIIATQFGAPYYWMSWSKEAVLVDLGDAEARIASGEVLNEPVFAFVHKYLKTNILPSL